MGKLFLIAIIGLGVALYFPDTRASVLEKGEPVLRPMLIWNAEREMEEIISGLQQVENIERRLPEKGEWVRWLDNRYAGDASRDPWGSLYLYEVQDDSFAVASNGPDREMKTDDDLRDVRVRNWRAKPARAAAPPLGFDRTPLAHHTRAPGPDHGPWAVARLPVRDPGNLVRHRADRAQRRRGLARHRDRPRRRGVGRARGDGRDRRRRDRGLAGLLDRPQGP